MSLKNMTKDDLELLSNKDITYMLLEESNKPINTANLFKKIIKLLELPESVFENKIGDYYTALATDKRFVMVEDGKWDLRSHHTSDKVIKVTDSDDDEEEEEMPEDKDQAENNENDDEDNYDDTEEEEYDDETNEELKDLVILDEDELELEQ